MGLMVLLGLWGALPLGCADATLVPFRDAARAYDAGRTALDAGDFVSANQRFSEARALDPSSATLPLWQGRALAASGDLPGAIRAADDAIAHDAKSGLAWYNRAAWRARSGDLAASAADLQQALKLNAATAWAAARDPDFAPHRQDSAFAGILPPADLLVAVEGPAESGFVGSELSVLFRLTGPAEQVPALSGPPVPGCLKQTRIVEDDAIGEGPSSGTVERHVRVYFRANASCVVTLGPFVASTPDGATHVEVAAIPVVVLGPTGAAGEAGTRPAAWVIPAGVRDGAAVDGWSVHLGGERPAGMITLEWRVDHQTREVGWLAIL